MPISCQCTDESIWLTLDLPFPVPLVKNSSSDGRMGREPSMGMQYL